MTPDGLNCSENRIDRKLMPMWLMSKLAWGG